MKPIGKNIPTKPVFDAEGYQSNLNSLNGERLPDLRRVKAKPLKRGGLRAGAGRKPSGNIPILLRLSPRTIGRLKQLAKKQRKNNSEVAGELIDSALSHPRRSLASNLTRIQS